MAKVLFKRYETDAEAQASNIVDGQFIVTKEGTSYIDYGTDRVAFGGLSYNEVFNFIYPVGSYYETSDTTFNPNTTWGGTWVLEEDGTVLVSKSSTTGSIFNDTLGTTVGEEKHTLTISEMPSHKHTTNVVYPFTSGGSYTCTPNSDKNSYTGIASDVVNATGGGQAHNIVQPSKIVNRWHRTA